jgi:hypothetical protein
MTAVREFVCGFLPWVHPGIGSLLRRADGHRSSRMEKHLGRCRRCRKQAALMEDAARRSHPCGPALDDLFDSIDLRIQAWCSLAGFDSGRVPRRAHVMNRELARALELYFGSETLRRIQACNRGNASAQRMAPVTRPLFAAFLGQKAAESLASHISGAIT